MSTMEERLRVVFETDLTMLRAAQGEIRRVFEGLKPTFTALGAILTGVVVHGLQGVLRTADAFNDVRRVMQGLGYDSDDVTTRVREMARSLLDATGYSEPEILKGFEALLAVTRNVDTALLLWPIALDLAAAKGIPVETAAEAIAKYYEDGSGFLERWYPFLKDAETPAGRLKSLMEDLAPLIGGAAERTASLAGAWRDVKTQLGEVAKALIPEGFAAGGMGILNQVSDALRELKAAAADLPETTKQFFALGGVIGLLLAGGSGVGGVATLAAKLGLGGLSGVLAGLSGIMAPLAVVVGVFGTAWITNFGGIQEKTRAFWQDVQPIIEDLKVAWGGLWDSMKETWELFRPIFEDFFAVTLDILFAFGKGILTVLNESMGLLRDLIVGDWTGVWDHLKAIVFTIVDTVAPGLREKLGQVVRYFREDFFNDLKTAFANLKQSIYDWGAGLISGFVEGIKSKIQAIRDAVASAIDAVKGFFGGGASAPSPEPAFSIPGMQHGGRVIGEGLAIVGEEGPELLRFRPGAEVVPLGSQLRGLFADFAAGLSGFGAAGVAAAGAGPTVMINAPISGNTFRDRTDIDYLVRRVSEEIGGAVGRGVGNWRGR